MAQVVERMQRANRTKTIGDGTSPKPQVQNPAPLFFSSDDSGVMVLQLSANQFGNHSLLI